MLTTLTKWQVWKRDSSLWLVARSKEAPEKLLHYGGPSYMMESDDMELIAEWEPMSISKAELKFLTEYNTIKPQPVTKLSGGWLSPDGKWYPCRYAQHDAIARRIVATLYGKIGSAGDLEEKQWIRVHDDGLVITHHLKRRPTAAQIGTLIDLSMGEDSEFVKNDEYRKHMLREIRWIEED